MQTRLTRKFRLRAALVIAVFYALCSVTPALAIALADKSAAAAHCLTSDHRGDAKPLLGLHDHGGGAFHSHAGDEASAADSDEPESPPGKCCGLFCTTALPAAYHMPPGGPIHDSTPFSSVQEDLTGRGPDRINRPPILSLSL